MEKKFRTWQILKKGNYPQGDITTDMLKELSSTFGQRGDIPIGKGHDIYFWMDNQPAEGWIHVNKNYGLNKKNDTFIVEGVELLEPLASEYEEGRFKKWSAVIARDAEYDDKNDQWKYGKWELMAVDVLGRTAPAIKGLMDLTNNNRKPELEKFGIQIEENNIVSYGDNKRQVMHFSADFTNEDINHESEDLKMSKELESKILELTKKQEEQEAKYAALLERNAKLEEQAKSAYTAHKNSEIGKLKKAVKGLPEKKEKSLFSILDGVELDINSQNSVYSVIADCINQLKENAKVFSNEMPSHLQNENNNNGNNDSDTENKEGEEILNSSYKSTKILIG